MSVGMSALRNEMSTMKNELNLRIDKLDMHIDKLYFLINKFDNMPDELDSKINKPTLIVVSTVLILILLQIIPHLSK